jgi:hypothetical protein
VLPSSQQLCAVPTSTAPQYAVRSERELTTPAEVTAIIVRGKPKEKGQGASQVEVAGGSWLWIAQHIHGHAFEL